MTTKNVYSGIVCWLLLCTANSLANAQNRDPVAGEIAIIGAKSGAVIQEKSADAGLEVTKASGLATVEARSAYQKKLLEFVSPSNRSSTLRDSLTSSLVAAAESGDEQFAALATDYQRTAANSLYHERQLQSMQFIGNMKMLGGVDAKRAVNAELNGMILELQKKSFQTSFLRRQARLENHLKTIRTFEIAPLQAATGNQQNFLLEVLQSKALEYGYSASQGTPLGAALMQLKLSEDDLSRIRLKKLTEGGYVSFKLLEGSGALGQTPFILRSLPLSAEAAKVDGLLTALASVDSESDDFVDKLIELRQATTAYEAAFLEQAGSGHEAARQGVQPYSRWRQARNYFTGLKAIINCLELENTPSILQNGNKYNPEQHGYGILPLVTFVASNSCQFAPASPGDADVYVRLHRKLLELQALLGTE